MKSRSLLSRGAPGQKPAAATTLKVKGGSQDQLSYKMAEGTNISSWVASGWASALGIFTLQGLREFRDTLVPKAKRCDNAEESGVQQSECMCCRICASLISLSPKPRSRVQGRRSGSQPDGYFPKLGSLVGGSFFVRVAYYIGDPKGH